jgi:hypothetical protein
MDGGNSMGSIATINSPMARPLPNRFSGSLSDLPPSQTHDVEPVLQSMLTAENIKMGPLEHKRKREEDLGEEDGLKVHPVEMVNAGVGVQRSTRSWK